MHMNVRTNGNVHAIQSTLVGLPTSALPAVDFGQAEPTWGSQLEWTTQAAPYPDGVPRKEQSADASLGRG